MNIQELKGLFKQVREYFSDDANELLDFTKRAYIQNEISFYDYRNLVRELELQGAVTPENIKQLS